MKTRTGKALSQATPLLEQAAVGLHQVRELLKNGAFQYGLERCQEWMSRLAAEEQKATADPGQRMLQGQFALCAGQFFLKLDQFEGAQEQFQRAAAVFDTLEATDGLATTLTSSAGGFLAAGSAEKAMERFRQAVHLWASLDLAVEEGLARLGLAASLAELGESRAAAKQAALGLHKTDSKGTIDQRIAARQWSVQVCRSNGDTEEWISELEALTNLQQARIRELLEIPSAMGSLTAPQSADTTAPLSVDMTAPPSVDMTAPQSADEAYFEAIQVFTAKAAHDMKEPIRMVGSFSTLLRKKYGPVLDAEGLEYLDIVSDANERMAELLQHLLEYTRLHPSGLLHAEVDLSDVCLLTSHRMREKLQAANARLDVQSLPRVLGTSTYLEKMLEQVLDNALKFNLKKQPLIRIESVLEGENAELIVHDNGIGIPAAHREEVFDLFRRLHSRSAYRGSGIGLAIVQRVAELHGGQCHFTESPLGGIALHIRLPLAS